MCIFFLSQTTATFKQKFDFIIGDRVRFREGVSQFYYGETGYDKKDVSTVSGIGKKKIIIDYPFCPGIKNKQTYFLR
jgi:hypothetical protein